MPEKTVEEYKEILREALSVKDQMSVPARQKILTFKNTLSDYIESIDELQDNQQSDGSDDAVYEVEKSDNKVSMLQSDLKDQAQELLTEIALVKKIM